MKSASRLFAAALLIGLAFRLTLLLIPTAPLATKVLEPTGDSPEYVRLAANLVHDHVFSQDSLPPFRPDILRTPLYPLFLALPYTVHRPSFIVLALALQLLLALFTIWLTRELGLELGLGPGASALAALLVALSPTLVFYSIKLTTETLFTFLLLVTLLLINRFRILHRWPELMSAGACCGLLILTRPIAAFFPLLLAVYVLFRVLRSSFFVPGSSFRLHPSSFIPPLILLACASIVLAPWVIRNERVAGRCIISTVFDYNISVYTGALTLAASKLIPLNEARDSMVARAQARFGPLDTNDQASYWAAMGRVGWQQALARPFLAAKLHAAGSSGGLLMPISVRPLLVFSGAHPESGTTGAAQVAQQTIQLAARSRLGQALTLVWRERLTRMPGLALAILAYAVLFHVTLLISSVVALFLRRSRNLLWLLLPILYFVLLTGPVGEARFRAPIEPLLCLFAAVALTRLPRTSANNPQDAHAI